MIPGKSQRAAVLNYPVGSLFLSGIAYYRLAGEAFPEGAVLPRKGSFPRILLPAVFLRVMFSNICLVIPVPFPAAIAFAALVIRFFMPDLKLNLMVLFSFYTGDDFREAGIVPLQVRP